jgi:hypothetical protein
VSWSSGRQGRKIRREEGEKVCRKACAETLRPSFLLTFSPSLTVRLLVVAVFLVLGAALLASSMVKDVGRDEQMYCTAGVLLGQGQMIYRDFSYPSQLPYHPLLLASLYRISGTTHYLLVGRLVSVVCDVLTILFIVLIYRSSFGPRRQEGWWFGLAAATLWVFNPLVDYAAGYAWNHDVVILCVVASLWLFLSTDFEKRTSLCRVAVVGVLLTLATFMRVTTVLIELLFLAAVLYAAGGTLRHRVRTALPFCGAALVVALWPLWVMAQAPQAFWLNLVRIPALYGRWLHETGKTFAKLPLTISSFTTPGYLVLLVLAGYLLGSLWRNRSSLDARERGKTALVVLLPVTFLVIAYIPPTTWPQYLAVPVPFLAITLAYPLLALARRAERPAGTKRYRAAPCLVGAAVVVAVLANWNVLSRCLFLVVPEQWTPVESHRQSVALAAEVREPGTMLTLGPLYALEAGRDIYPELSCGSIVYRVGDLLSAQERQITHTVGVKTLGELVTTHPPAGVLVGVEPDYFAFLEDPLRKLVPPGWRRDTYGGALQVYRRP